MKIHVDSNSIIKHTYNHDHTKTKWNDEAAEKKRMSLTNQQAVTTDNGGGGGVNSAGDSSLLTASAIEAMQIENSSQVCPCLLG